MAGGLLLSVLGMLAALAVVVQATGSWSVLRGAANRSTPPGMGPVRGGNPRPVQGVVCGWYLCVAHNPRVPGGAYATPAELHTASPTETHHQVRSQTPLFIRCLSQHTSYYLYADPVKCVFVINKHCVKPAVCETRDTCNRIFMQVVLVETSLCLETVKFQLTS